MFSAPTTQCGHRVYLRRFQVWSGRFAFIRTAALKRFRSATRSPFTRDGLLWLHFNLTDARALQWLASADLQAPAQARSLLLSKDNYQQLHVADDSVYGVISDLMRDIAEATEETGYLRFVMTEQILVSGRHHALCAVDATRRALEGGRRIESIAALLETIIENVADAMDRLSDRLAQSLDEIEEQVLSGEATDLRQKLGRLRRSCVRLHRQLSGLRMSFTGLSRGIHRT
jgi:zinc transporter